EAFFSLYVTLNPPANERHLDSGNEICGPGRPDMPSLTQLFAGDLELHGAESSRRARPAAQYSRYVPAHFATRCCRASAWRRNSLVDVSAFSTIDQSSLRF